MFLSKHGASGKETFDVIYSALQKALRRGDLHVALDMAKEFSAYPNALKKRLMQNCTEDCPDLALVHLIYQTKPVLTDLIQYIPIICNHIKSRTFQWGFRVACEKESIVQFVTYQLQKQPPKPTSSAKGWDELVRAPHSVHEQSSETTSYEQSSETTSHELVRAPTTSQASNTIGQLPETYISLINANDNGSLPPPYDKLTDDGLLLDPLSIDDKPFVMLIKCRTYIRYQKIDEYIDFFQKNYKMYESMKLKTMYNFISKSQTFLYALIAYTHLKYLHVRLRKNSKTNALILEHSPRLKLPAVESLVSFDEGNPEVFDPPYMNIHLTKFRTDPIPDYAYDKHVHKPKDGQGDYKFFVEEGTLISPRMPETMLERYGKKLYLSIKKRTREFCTPIIVNEQQGTDKITRKTKSATLVQPETESAKQIPEKLEQPKKPSKTNQQKTEPLEIVFDENELQETETHEKGASTLLTPSFTFPVIQTQLVTNKSKPQVYYADTNHDNSYSTIIKGPYKQTKTNQLWVMRQIASDKIKTPLGLLSPLSYKQEIDGKTYLFSKNFVTISPMEENTEIRSSKIESNVKIYTGNHFHYDHSQISTLTKNEQVELFKALLFRKCIGTNDTCPRNILHVDSSFITIDDPILLKDTRYIWKTKLNPKIAKQYESAIKSCFDELLPIIQRWKKLFARTNNADLKTHATKILDELENSDNWKF